MKYILIFCAIIVAGSILLSKHFENKRYQNPSPYDYVVSEKVDANYHDPAAVERYYIQAQEIGTYARSQWFNHKIDVRHPKEKKNGATEAARNYAHKLAAVKQLEQQLIQSAELKKQGFNKQEVAVFEDLGEHPIKRALRQKFSSLAENPLKQGDRGQLVLEVQKLLKEKGNSIILDGIFDDETTFVVKKVQAKAGLYQSGIADNWLVGYLLNSK